MRLVLFGAPGAGKGTQAALLSKEFGIPHVSTGDIIRKEIREASELGVRVKQIVESGGLVDDATVTEIMRKRLSEPDAAKGFILDGYPRTVAQAKALDDFAAEKGWNITAVLNFVVPNDELVRRLSSRLTCRKCGAVYNAITLPPKVPGKCDKCGGEVAKRADEEEPAIRKRLAVYEKETAPVLNYYGKSGLLKGVNGSGKTPDRTHADILRVLG